MLDKNNKVIESYACAIYNGKEYCIKGGNSSFYIENKKVLEGLGSLGLNCILEDNYSYCKDGSTRLYATSSGDVFADDNNGSCDVEDSKLSYCENS